MATQTTVKPDAPESARACHVVDHRGASRLHFDREHVDQLLADGHFFWLDLFQPNDDDFAILRERFGFHPLAIEDSEYFHQRAKLDDYDDFVFLVVFGATPDEDALVEVHLFYSERCLITVHRDDSPAFREVRERYEKRRASIDHPPLLLYKILDALADSFFPILADFDDHIDELEDTLFTRANQAQLQEIFGMKRTLVGIRKAITPQRDLFASLVGNVELLPGASAEDERYFRDVYDHLIRISELVDSYRDLLTGALDVYLSTVSNRMNAVMKQLAVIATIFLPLTFLTGFFGQNFGWLVGHIGSWETFLALGIGTEVLTLAAFLILFKRRRWF